ncbi:hypothetical protein BJ508DRAFT_364335 [Ascobolus immersus RN42]|uniref:Uncharacterized protein n=1 Tax=Ascobolus immersus RN42 TaxID=1160509 RepID=A0A3N4I0J4_ASCIM|nr:hypothetical protein BJ508DRAFT_364335 [Ascobolus immersus RN42]
MRERALDRIEDGEVDSGTFDGMPELWSSSAGMAVAAAASRPGVWSDGKLPPPARNPTIYTSNALRARRTSPPPTGEAPNTPWGPSQPSSPSARKQQHYSFHEPSTNGIRTRPNALTNTQETADGTQRTGQQPIVVMRPALQQHHAFEQKRKWHGKAWIIGGQDRYRQSGLELPVVLERVPLRRG